MLFFISTKKVAKQMFETSMDGALQDGRKKKCQDSTVCTYAY